MIYRSTINGAPARLLTSEPQFMAEGVSSNQIVKFAVEMGADLIAMGRTDGQAFCVF